MQFRLTPRALLGAAGAVALTAIACSDPVSPARKVDLAAPIGPSFDDMTPDGARVSLPLAPRFGTSSPDGRPNLSVAPGGYRIVTLGVLPGAPANASSNSQAVNDSGWVAGWSDVASPAGAQHAFLWKGGAMTDLGTLGGPSSRAYGITNAGKVVGWAHPASGGAHAVLWQNGTVTDLGVLSGYAATAATAINEQGQIFGYAQSSTGKYRAVLFAVGSAPVSLGGLPGGDQSIVYGLNENGDVVGAANVSTGGKLFPAIKKAGQPWVRLTGIAGETSGYAWDINASGEVAGYSFLTGTSGAVDRAARWDTTAARAVQNLGTLPNGTISYAFGVSDSGRVVGWTGFADNTRRATLFTASEGLQAMGEPTGAWGSQATGIAPGGQWSSGVALMNGYNVAARWELLPKVHLTIVYGRGLTTPQSYVDAEYDIGARVPFHFAASAGNTRLAVRLDEQGMQDTGTVVMDSAHVLMASADSIVTLPSGTEALYQASRALLTASDPVAAYREYIERLADVYAQYPGEDGERRVAAATYLGFDPIGDSTAMQRVDEALDGQDFEFPLAPPATSSASSLRAAQAHGLESLEAANPTRTPTAYVYVNGILTPSIRAAATIGILRARLPASIDPQFRAAADTFVYHYNRTYAEMPTLKQRQMRCYIELKHRSSFVGLVSFYNFMRDCVNWDTYQNIHTQDLVECGREVRNILLGTLGYDYEAEPDAHKLADTVLAKWHRTHHIVMIPHSQGNLLTIEGLRQLKLNGQWNPSLDTLGIGVVSLASPMSVGWPTEPEFTVHGINVEGDWVPHLGFSQWQPTPTPRTDSLRALYAEMGTPLTDGDISFDMAVRADEFASHYTTLHFVNESYLGQPVIWNLIVSSVNDLQARFRIVGIETTGTMPTLDENSLPSYDLSQNVRLRTQDGGYLSARALTWSTSNASEISVSPDGIAEVQPYTGDMPWGYCAPYPVGAGATITASLGRRSVSFPVSGTRYGGCVYLRAPSDSDGTSSGSDDHAKKKHRARSRSGTRRVAP